MILRKRVPKSIRFRAWKGDKKRRFSFKMEVETENVGNSIKIPLSASDEYIQLFVDELEDDPTSLISLLFDEYVPPKYWIQIAVLEGLLVLTG